MRKQSYSILNEGIKESNSRTNKEYFKLTIESIRSMECEAIFQELELQPENIQAIVDKRLKEEKLQNISNELGDD